MTLWTGDRVLFDGEPYLVLLSVEQNVVLGRFVGSPITTTVDDVLRIEFENEHSTGTHMMGKHAVHDDGDPLCPPCVNALRWRAEGCARCTAEISRLVDTELTERVREIRHAARCPAR
jgi:hypothetical protein